MQFLKVNPFDFMTMEELELLIREGEGYNVEYKQSFPSKLSELATELCALPMQTAAYY